MKYSFLENNNNTSNNFKVNKKHLLEYDQFDDDEEYDSDDTYDQEVDDMIDKKAEKIKYEKYTLNNVEELNNILINKDIPLEEKELYIKYNKDLINQDCSIITEFCKRKNIEVVKLLLKYGADVNATDEYGNFPLLEAIIREDFNLVKLLLDHNANVNQKGSNGNTPLLFACSSQDYRIINLLLRYGADVNMKNNAGYAPIDMVRRNSRIAEILIANGAKVLK